MCSSDLNAKAAIFALETLFEQRGRRWPVMISGTITDASGRTLSGQVTEAFWHSVRHVGPLLVGLNCALGAKEMRPYIAEISRIADTFVSCYPNAGLPNAFGEYDESPEETAAIVGEFADSGFVNLVGGCCGTTPAHIAAIAGAVAEQTPRTPVQVAPALRLSGLEPVTVDEDVVGAPADPRAALQVVALPLLVEGHHHDRGAVLAAQPGQIGRAHV